MYYATVCLQLRDEVKFYGLRALGYTFVTMVKTKNFLFSKKKKFLKTTLVRITLLNFKV